MAKNETEAQGLVDDFFARLEKEYAPAPNWTVTIGSQVFTGRSLQSAYEQSMINTKGTKFLEACLKSPHPTWRPFLPIDEGVAKRIAFLRLSLESPKLSDVDLLRFAKQYGQVFEDLTNQALFESAPAVYKKTEEEVESNLENSEATPSDSSP